MICKNILQSEAMLGRSPSEILSKANAGHEYPMIKRPGEKFELYKDKHSFVIGGLEETKYNEYEILLEPGMMIFFYTDGLSEATNSFEEAFGIQRIIEALGLCSDAEPLDVLKNSAKRRGRFCTGS